MSLKILLHWQSYFW